jgi:hypothetical protein
VSATISNRERATLESFGFSTARATRKLRRERDLAAKRAKRDGSNGSKRDGSKGRV